MRQNIAIVGGGTGGHLSIARSVKEALNRRGIKPFFIGSTGGQDKQWFAQDEGFEAKYFLDTQSVVDRGLIGKIKSLGKIAKAAWMAQKIIQEKNIDIVFSVGGYSAAPGSIASIIRGKKLYIHEQNAVMGRLNALFSKKATAIFSPYVENSPVKDYPISEIFFDNARVRTEIKTIIFLGGSQGAHAINVFAQSVAKMLHGKDIKIIHQCGRGDYDALQEFYSSENIEVDLFSFDKKLYEKIAEADFAISRAGASTLWELTASQLPALYIPYPYAAGDHQYFNAKFLLDQKLGFLCREAFLSKDIMQQVFDADIAKMSSGLQGLVSPDGADKIVDYMGL